MKMWTYDLVGGLRNEFISYYSLIVDFSTCVFFLFCFEKIHMYVCHIKVGLFFWYFCFVVAAVVVIVDLSILYSPTSGDCHSTDIQSYFSGPSTPAWFIRSAMLFSKSSIRFPMSSMRVIIWSDIVWNLSWTFCKRFWTCNRKKQLN